MRILFMKIFIMKILKHWIRKSIRDIKIVIKNNLESNVD